METIRSEQAGWWIGVQRRELKLDFVPDVEKAFRVGYLQCLLDLKERPTKVLESLEQAASIAWSQYQAERQDT